LVDPVTQALLVKDIRTFLREPAQWGQTVLVFGLLFLYTGNLRRLVSDYQDPFWSIIISYLNLLVCSLSLSTLTTRFIYPQLSQEGQRLWLIGLSPVPMARVLRTKLWLTSVVTGALTLALTVVSSISLDLPFERAAYFMVAITLLTFGLNALALGLGTIFPDFREANPAKVVSGFGGTLCLITSFLFILACVGVALLPALSELHIRLRFLENYPQTTLKALSLAGIFVLTGIFGVLPYRLAEKRIKTLDYFTKS
jgi:ABC-2 type transport system permease protein